MDTKKKDPTLQPYLPGDLQEKSEMYFKRRPNEILGDAQSGKAQSKKDNAALREASMILWLAASQPYEAGSRGEDRQARLQTIFERVERAGFRPEKTVIDARDGQSLGRIQPGGDEKCLGHEGIGNWSARGEEQK